ncbi:SEN34 subunit of tRNA-splicing endonuclease [Ascodesmis nigricans]|uniref:tRNA-splicing endonuclease subunit Sen34 n=1 Tax=Ascodesmis nigricans TaxID=341454 RepID=A0A4S2N0F4_9PEZI|nr:SEN34 subunit of tRNA-splicing endonuclease [Ascodesmis nigricans]
MPKQKPVTEPFPIFSVGNRFLLYDVNVVSHVRAKYHVCGTLSGTLPQIPQQNLFLGLPLELMVEEAALLVEKGAAYVVNDVATHKTSLESMSGPDRTAFLARRLASSEAEAVARHERNFQSRKAFAEANNLPEPTPTEPDMETRYHHIKTNSEAPYYSLKNSPDALKPSPDPAAFAIYTHLQEKGYFLSPGLRFGCQFMAYPGDPLRFHSHFLVTGLKWDEDIDILDIVTGGRLGTGVKKAWMFGGKQGTEKEDGESRVFSVEWGGF